MATASGVQINHSSGSSSDTERSANEDTEAFQIQPAEHTSNSLEDLLRYTSTSTPVPFHTRAPIHMYSYPIIDMRKAHQLGSPQFHKIRVKSTDTNDLKFEVGLQCKAKTSTIHIIEEEGRKEEVLLKTVIVILPETGGEEHISVMIETFQSVEDVHPHILCARLPVNLKVSDAKKLVMEDLGWKGLVFCKNGYVIEDELLLKSCNFENLEKIQALQQSSCRIEFIYQPRSDVLSIYYLEVDMNKSVKHVKKQFENHFRDEVQKQGYSKESTIHFCFQNYLLEDKKCFGLILRRNIKEEKISIHFGSKNAILVDLKYRVGRKTRYKLLIVSNEISTMSLRAEVSKHLCVDPKAVKLTFEGKLIDEHDNLGQVYKEKWCSGCRIVAGVKKCKTLQIRHPTECTEVPFEMYMLEPVCILKQKIAEKWGLDSLQILLFCRGFQMENRQPLQHYPIKNNMEIGLRLFEHRIIIKVMMIKKKKRIRLIVDDSCTSTVDDLLRFCAHHFSYDRKCSRGVFKDRCLKRKCTLAEEGIQSGDTVIIAYFDQPVLLQGSLINIYMVDHEGHIVKRLGAVNSGLLLHAPKTAEVPQTEETCVDNGPVPEGISICDKEDVCCASSPDGHMMGSDVKSVSARDETLVSVKQTLKRKKEFLKRARWVNLQRLLQSQRKQIRLQSPKQEEKPFFYLNDTENDPETITEGLKAQELSLDEETGRKTIVTSTDNNAAGQCSNTEVKFDTRGLNPHRQGIEIHGSVDSLKDEHKNCVRGEIDFDGPASNKSTISQRVKCIENCCQKILEAQNQNHLISVSSQVAKQQDTLQETVTVNHYSEQGSKSFHKETQSHLTNDLSGCETETSGCESARAYKPKIPLQRVEKAVETDSSDIECVTSRHGEDCQCNKCWSGNKFVCPYLQQIHRPSFYQRKPKSHTLSDSDVAVVQLAHIHRQLPLNHTFPTSFMMSYTEPNADIETSGITFPLLWHVAKYVGTKWKQLLRKLQVDETEVSSIEYKYSNAGLQELAIQALLSWKRGKGIEGSLEVLLKALEGVGLKSVAEQCQNVGYQTA